MLELMNADLTQFHSINDGLKEVLFHCISQNTLSFFEILVVAYIYDDLLKLDAWYRGSHSRGLHISINFLK